MSPCGNQRSHRSSVASAAGTAQGRPSASQARQPGSPECVFPPAPEQPNPLFWLGWAGKNGSGQGSHLSRPADPARSEPEAAEPSRLPRPTEGSLQEGFGDTAITPRLVDAVFGNGLPDLLIPEPDQSMATPPGYVMACAAKRRQGGKLQRQCLIPVRARHMIEIETAIDTTPDPRSTALGRAAPTLYLYVPTQAAPGHPYHGLATSGAARTRGRYRDAAEDSSSDHLSSRTSSREAARVAAGGALS